MALHVDELDLHLDTFSPTTRDLRSHSSSTNRERKQKQKYYSYRAVHPSWIGQEYYALVPTTSPTSRLPNSRQPTTIPFHISAQLAHHKCCPNWALYEYIPEASSLVARITMWTKCDNYIHKDAFPTSGPDRRHSRGRRVRERFSQGYEIERLGRKQKQRGHVNKEVDEELVAHITKMDERDCFRSCPCMRWVFGWFPDEEVIQDVYRKQLRLGDVCKGERVKRGLGAWDEQPLDIGYGQEDYEEDDDYEEEEDYEETQEDESHSGAQPVWDTMSLLESLLSSSAVVIVNETRSDDQNSLLSYDAISDLEEAIIEGEWDVVSDAS